VLIAGRVHPHVRERVEAQFDAVSIDAADARLVAAEIADTVRAVAGVFTAGAEFIDALPRLEIIAGFGVGYDGIAAAHAASRGVIVTNTPDVLSDEVADATIALLINTLRELPAAERYLREGRWRKDGPYPLSRLTLRGRKVGIYGLGRIGLAVAERLEGFGVSIAYHSRNRRDDVDYAYAPSLLELARQVDTLIVIVPGGASTEKTVNADILQALGPDGVVINVGRGSTIDCDALAAALKDGTTAAAGLDVFPEEPNVPQALLDLPNISLLPHLASASVATRDAMADLAVDNLVSWFGDGRPLTPVPECAGLLKRR